MQDLKLFFLVAILAATSACTTTGRLARVDPASVAIHPENADCKLTRDHAGDKRLAINLDCFRFADRTDAFAYQLAAESHHYRNRLQGLLISQANTVCELEKGRIYANKATLDSVLDLITSGTSAASTIVGGDLAKSILSGIAGVSTATRSNVNANIYQNQIVPAITKVMDAERARLLIMLQSRRAQDRAEYNVDDMVRLVNEYHQACSFQKGVQLLLDAALNKEGSDAIIRAINLRAAEQNILRQLETATARRLLGVPQAEIDQTVSALETKLREVQLQKVENLQAVDNTTPETAESNSG